MRFEPMNSRGNEIVKKWFCSLDNFSGYGTIADASPLGRTSSLKIRNCLPVSGGCGLLLQVEPTEAFFSSQCDIICEEQKADQTRRLDKNHPCLTAGELEFN